MNKPLSKKEREKLREETQVMLYHWGRLKDGKVKPVFALTYDLVERLLSTIDERDRRIARLSGEPEPLITLNNTLIAPSLNEWYSGSHWSKRSRLKKLWHDEVYVEAKQRKLRGIKPMHYPVTITTQTFFPHKRQRDTANCFTANKLAEDAIVKAGLLPNDTNLYVGEHRVLTPAYGDESMPKGGTVVKVWGKEE